jgi:hypothetical protein
MSLNRATCSISHTRNRDDQKLAGVESATDGVDGISPAIAVSGIANMTMANVTLFLAFARNSLIVMDSSGPARPTLLFLVRLGGDTADVASQNRSFAPEISGRDHFPTALLASGEADGTRDHSCLLLRVWLLAEPAKRVRWDKSAVCRHSRGRHRSWSRPALTIAGRAVIRCMPLPL